MSLSPTELLDGRLKPSSHERKFEEFLKQHQLHFTQSECGLGWVERNRSNSGMYSHSAGLDVGNEAIRQVLPSVMGSRSLFRFMFPSSEASLPHLTTSNQQLSIPGVKLQLPKNPELQLDVGAMLMLVKSQALRELRMLGFEPDANQVTMLMAIWYGWSWQRKDVDQGVPTSMIQWLSGLVPPYLGVLKWVWPERFQNLSLDEAIQAKGIPARRLATLYPMQENES